MSHTNVHLPYRYATRDTLVAEVEILQFKLKQADARIDAIEREFQNIPKAIKEFGYVDLYDEVGNFIMRIIKGPDTEVVK